MRKTLSYALSVSMVATSLVGYTPAHAQTAQGLEDMIGMRGSSTDSELSRRGYSFVKNQGIAQMWWNASTRRCVSLAVDDGRVQSVQSTSAADCGQQQSSQGLDDLVGFRGSSAESELGQRGYSFVKKVGIAGFWWNGSARRCVAVAVDDGRVQSVQSTSAADCNQQQAGSSNNKNDNLTGVLIGAAAIGLVAALATHHKRSDDKKNTPTYNAEYERGYNDAMYSGHYASNDSEGYHSGYMAGEAERSNRRAANTPIVRGAPAEAQRACARRGDEQFSVAPGSTVPVSVYDYGQGNYEVTVASGHQRANCAVNANGRISDFLRL